MVITNREIGLLRVLGSHPFSSVDVGILKVLYGDVIPENRLINIANQMNDS